MAKEVVVFEADRVQELVETGLDIQVQGRRMFVQGDIFYAALIADYDEEDDFWVYAFECIFLGWNARGEGATLAEARGNARRVLEGKRPSLLSQ